MAASAPVIADRALRPHVPRLPVLSLTRTPSRHSVMLQHRTFLSRLCFRRRYRMTSLTVYVELRGLLQELWPEMYISDIRMWLLEYRDLRVLGVWSSRIGLNHGAPFLERPRPRTTRWTSRGCVRWVRSSADLMYACGPVASRANECHVRWCADTALLFNVNSVLYIPHRST
ncbi:hypothetical protein K466DRAFT_22581 [Polyporus arcularius HHB13444]|uniref:Uncharacterized protein n=1 Tax=Polyporus arcularius HHB13444 TaxID=1314778 RepID=A0A5C3PX43_9APHY|nr:hypothetical protein K466DRAFT_22581 [Polyporus arcularius HHB13444]